MRITPLACLLIACGSPPPVSPVPPAQSDAGAAAAVIDAPPDAGELHVGAVPVPGEYQEEELSENLVDASVVLKELPPVTAKWKTKKLLNYGGHVVIALSEWHHTSLALSVVDTVTKTETGYPGTLWTYEIAPAAPPARDSANAYPPRTTETASYGAAVLFAVRVLPKEGAPETERRQYVVYTNKTSLLVAQKLVTDSDWSPRLRIDLPRAVKFVAMDPGWH